MMKDDFFIDEEPRSQAAIESDLQESIHCFYTKSEMSELLATMLMEQGLGFDDLPPLK